MRFVFRSFSVAVAMALSAMTAVAVPVLFDYDSIRNGHIEDFESWPEGLINPPQLNDFSRVDFERFSYWSEGSIITATDTLCHAAADKCLTNNDLLSRDSERIFGDFGERTARFGVDLGLVNPDLLNALEVAVYGKSGSGVFSGFSSETTTIKIAFLTGLLQIRFRHFDIGDGRYNYSFDDVKTAPVPLPARMLLALAGSAGLLGSIRRAIVDGVMDLRGILGMVPEIRNGFSANSGSVQTLSHFRSRDDG